MAVSSGHQSACLLAASTLALSVIWHWQGIFPLPGAGQPSLWSAGGSVNARSRAGQSKHKLRPCEIVLQVYTSFLKFLTV